MRKMSADKRLLRIARRLLDGETFWSSGGSPRFSQEDFRGLYNLGFKLQGEHVRGEPEQLYALNIWSKENEALYRKLVTK